MNHRYSYLLPLILAVSFTHAQGQTKLVHRHSASKRPPNRQRHEPVVTREIRLVDSTGKTRMLLSVASGQPILQFLSTNGTPAITAALDIAGHSSIRLNNSDPQGPTASIEIDDKGSHVKFDRPGGASSYLFLDNAGVSGLVLIDAEGKRRFNVVVQANGNTSVERLDDNGNPISPFSQ